MAASDRVFTALYLASFKLPIAVCALLKAADVGVRSVVTGFWLAMLTPHMIERLDAWYYSRGFPMYLDPRYNRSGWFDWEKPVIERHFSGLPEVLIAAGAGAGREMLALNRMGIRVVGYEHNPDLCDLGNRLLVEDGWDATLRPARPNALTEEPGLYGGAIVGWATYSLMPGRKTRVTFLTQLRARCRDGAPVLISYFRRSGDGTFYRLSAALANSIRPFLARPRLELGDTLAASFAHYFSEEEIHAELTEAGFQPVDSAVAPCARVVALAR